MIVTALGGQTVTTTVEGRQRFSVNMRYPRDLRDSPQAIANDVLINWLTKRYLRWYRAGESGNR